MPSTEAALLQVEGLCSHYGPVRVLSHVSLAVRAGELVAIVGANGAGKSTLLRSLSAVQPKSGGTVRFDGRDISRLPAHRVVAAGVCHVPEGRQVFAPLSVEDNLRLGAYLHRQERAWVERELDRVYTLFPILGERRAQLAGTLSGGQQQMLALQKLLLCKPELLLLDEPTKGLDLEMRREVARMVGECRDEGVTVVIASHDVAFLAEVADRTSLLFDGAVTLTGETDEFLRESWVWGR